MNAKISELLDLYISLSGEKYDINDLLDELNRFNKKIPELTEKITKLQNSMTNEKYFDASSEIIDRNIELSLQKKLDHLRNKLAGLKEQNDKIIKKRKEEENLYSSLNKTLVSCQSFIHDLSKFDYEISSNSIEKLIEMENARYDRVVNEIDSKSKLKDEAISSSNDLNEEIAKLEREIQIEEDRLSDVKESLNNKALYINEEEKANDINLLNEMTEELNDIKNRQANLSNSVTYQCHLVKKEVDSINFDQNKVLSVVKAIASALNTLPYLNVEDDTLLSEEYSQLNSQRDELAALIENKRYSLKSKRPYEIRAEYITQKINNAKDIKEDYESLLKFIINQEIECTVDNLLKLKSEKNELDDAFCNNDKASMQKQYIDELIVSYEQDLSNTLAKARDIKEKIGIQESEIQAAEKEIDNINSEKKLQFDLENPAEKEKDNKMLENILDKIDYLNNRINVGMTPNQIFDQIEMVMYSKGVPEKAEIKVDPIVNDLNNVKVKEETKSEPSSFTFEKIADASEPLLNGDEMIVSPDKYISDVGEETKEFSFSPIDNTDFISFEDAYNTAN